MPKYTGGEGPPRDSPCLTCVKAAGSTGDGVCRDNLAKPNSDRCERCWVYAHSCRPPPPVLVPLVRNVVEAIAAGDEAVLKEARALLRVESRKYPRRVEEKLASNGGTEHEQDGRRRARKRKSASAESNKIRIPDEERKSSFGTVASEVKQELLEVGNEIYQSGAELLEVGIGPMKMGDRLKDIGERLAYIASKLGIQ